MVINCAFIGFGKSTTRSICRMYLTARIAGMSRIFFVPCEAGRTGSHLFPYPFHQRSDEVLNDPDVKLVVVCTHADTISSTRNARWKPGKMCWSKNVHPDACPGEGAVCVGEKQRATVTPYQNRRFDSCFLTAKKGLKVASWERLLKWKAILTITPGRRNQTWVAAGWRVLWPWWHTMDQIISLFGRPDHVAYDTAACAIKPILTILSKRNCFMRSKSHRQNQPSGENRLSEIYVHGKKGSFIKYGIDQQETSRRLILCRANRDSQRMIRSVCGVCQ